MTENLHHQVWPPGRPFRIEASPDTLDQNLKNTLARVPDKAAIVFYDSPLSYRELDAAVEQVAGYLQQHCQIGKGQRVAIYAQNCPQYVIAFYAILRVGGVVVPVNPMNLTEEVRYVLEDAGCSTVFCAGELLPQLQPLLDAGELAHVIAIRYADYLTAATDLQVPAFLTGQPALEETAMVQGWQRAAASGLKTAPVEIAVEDLAVLPYTSGSTGRGKGCMHNHLSTQHAMQSVYDWFQIRQDDVLLSVAPMFHVVGMQAGMNASVCQGCTMILVPRWDRDVVAQCIQRYRISVWPAVPTMVVDLLNHPQLASFDFSSLRVLFGGGSSMPRAVADKLFEVCGVSFLEGYGLTETICPATANPPHKPQNQCGGIPVFNTDIRIIDTLTQEEVENGALGEIIIHGPQVMQGYWQNPEATAEAFMQLAGKRFLRTGDIGRIDPEGYVFIIDRIKRMINASGFKVWPTEVESVLYRHPALQEVCIVGTYDERRGEMVKALAVLKPGMEATTEQDIIDWARDHMAVYKVPRAVEFVDSLPKSGSGKILWKALQDRERG